MNPIVAEHVFVTTLPGPQALPRLGQALRSRGFKREGQQQLDPMRADWTQFTFRRGLESGARARTFADYPQEIRVEWDRQRITLALSIDPGNAGGPMRSQLTELLLLRASLLEDLATGARPDHDILYEWAHAEEPLLLSSAKTAAADPTAANFFRSYWGWACIGLCVLMAGTAWSMPNYSTAFRAVLASVGGAGALGCLILGLVKLPIAPSRIKTHAWTIAIACWVGLFISGVFAKSFAHMNGDASEAPAVAANDAGGGEQNAPAPGAPQGDGGKPAAPGGDPQPRHDFPARLPPPRAFHRRAAQTLDGALADLKSMDPDLQRRAADWIYNAKIPPGPGTQRIPDSLRPVLTAEDPGARERYVTLFCRYAGSSNVPDLVKCLGFSTRYTSCWRPAIESLIRLDPAAAAKGARAHLADDRFENDLLNPLKYIAETDSPAKADAQKLADTLTSEWRVARIRNGERIWTKLLSQDEAFAALGSSNTDMQVAGIDYLESSTLTAAQKAPYKDSLRKLLESENHDVLIHATEAFIKRADKQDTEVLTKLAYPPHERGFIKGPAIAGLLIADPPAGRKILEEDPRDSSTRRAAFSELSKAGAAAEAAYIELLKSDSRSQNEAIDGLAQVGTGRAIAPLQALALTLTDDRKSHGMKNHVLNVISAIRARTKGS